MDSYEIRWKRSAERELRNLDSKQIFRILQKIETLATDPFPRGCHKLRATEQTYRIRVGDYRVIYQVD